MSVSPSPLPRVSVGRSATWVPRVMGKVVLRLEGASGLTPPTDAKGGQGAQQLDLYAWVSRCVAVVVPAAQLLRALHLSSGHVVAVVAVVGGVHGRPPPCCLLLASLLAAAPLTARPFAFRRVQVKLGEHDQRTGHAKGTLAPSWRQKFEWDGLRSKLTEKPMVLEVRNNDPVYLREHGKAAVLGRAELPLREMLIDDAHEARRARARSLRSLSSSLFFLPLLFSHPLLRPLSTHARANAPRLSPHAWPAQTCARWHPPAHPPTRPRVLLRPVRPPPHLF